MGKKTQIQIVKDQLLQEGHVTRNWCLARFISRLSAIIQNLEEQGWEFTAGDSGKDYMYTVVNAPDIEKKRFTKAYGYPKKVYIGPTYYEVQNKEEEEKVREYAREEMLEL